VTREADNPKGDDLSRIRRDAKRLLRDCCSLNTGDTPAPSPLRSSA
jgi:hypothetical protein